MSQNFDLYDDDGMGESNPSTTQDYGDLIGENESSHSRTPPRPPQAGFRPYNPPNSSVPTASGSGTVKVEPIQSIVEDKNSSTTSTLPQNPNLPMRPIAGISNARIIAPKPHSPILPSNGLPNHVKGALSAIYLGDLHWWTSDSHIQAACATIGVLIELKDIAFSEHKINGKSKGLAFVECGSVEKAAIVKTWFETNTFQEKKVTVQLCPGGTGQNPFKTLPREPYARNNNGQNQNQNYSNNNNGHLNHANNNPTRPPPPSVVAGSSAPAHHNNNRTTYSNPPNANNNSGFNKSNNMNQGYNNHHNNNYQQNQSNNNSNLGRDSITKTYKTFPSNVAQSLQSNNNNINNNGLPFPPPPGGFMNYPGGNMMGMNGMNMMPQMGMGMPVMPGMGGMNGMGGMDNSGMWGMNPMMAMNGMGGMMNGFDMSSMMGMNAMGMMGGVPNVNGMNGGNGEGDEDGSRKRSRMDAA